MKIALFGTCRLSFIRHHFSCTAFDDDISFVHSTKDILQLLRFITKQIDIPDNINRFCFRTSILNRHPVAYSDKFLAQFNEADVFVIEICSMTKYLYQGYYLHHLAVDRLFPFYVDSPQEVLLGTTVEYQDKQEIEEDISEIIDMVYPKKVMIVSHINASTDALDPYLKAGGLYAAVTRVRRLFSSAASTSHRKMPASKPATIEKREQLIQLLQSITRDKGIPFFDPTVILKRYRQKKILQKEEPGLPPSHYTEFGGKVVGRLYAGEIKKIMEGC
jgi:hypothetical protein